MASSQTNSASFEAFPSENRPFFSAQELRKIYEKQEDFMKTGLTKKQKTTDIYFNAKDPLAEVYTHDTNLKKRLRKYADKYPELCKQTDDDGLHQILEQHGKVCLGLGCLGIHIQTQSLQNHQITAI